jgi:SPW repeat
MLCSIWTKPRTARRRSRALPRGVTTMRGGSPRQNRAAARVLWVAVLAIAALAAFAEWEEWLNLIVGLWVAVSPWVVGFSANARAAWDHLVVGLIVALVAAVRLWFVHQGPPRVTA